MKRSKFKHRFTSWRFCDKGLENDSANSENFWDKLFKVFWEHKAEVMPDGMYDVTNAAIAIINCVSLALIYTTDGAQTSKVETRTSRWKSTVSNRSIENGWSWISETNFFCKRSRKFLLFDEASWCHFWREQFFKTVEKRNSPSRQTGVSQVVNVCTYIVEYFLFKNSTVF